MELEVWGKSLDLLLFYVRLADILLTFCVAGNRKAA